MINKDPFDKVPNSLRPVTDDIWAKEFIPVQEKVFDHIHYLAEQNLFDSKVCLCHRQLCNWVGGKAFSSFEFSSSKFWSENDTVNQSLDWNLALWQFVHVFPLGFLIANHSFKNEPYRSWNPAFQGIKKFSRSNSIKIERSNRALDGGMMACGLFHQLFVHGNDRLDPAIYKALLDAFSSLSNPDNPINSSVKRAIKGSLFLNPYPIPFYWAECLNHLFQRSPEELVNFQNALIYGSAGGHSSAPSIDLSQFNDEHETPVPETQQPTPITESLSSLTNPGKSIINMLIKETSDIFEERGRPVNAKGAMFHKVENYWFSVHPWVIRTVVDKINQHTSIMLDEDDILYQLLQLNFKEANGVFMDGSTVKGKVSLLFWPKKYVQSIIDDPDKIPANPTLKIQHETNTQAS